MERDLSATFDRERRRIVCGGSCGRCTTCQQQTDGDEEGEGCSLRAEASESGSHHVLMLHGAHFSLRQAPLIGNVGAVIDSYVASGATGASPSRMM